MSEALPDASLSGPTITMTGPTGSTTYTATTANIPPKSEPKGDSDSKMYTEEELNAARKQEKDKLYKRLETMQETVARLEQEAKQRQESEEALAKQQQEQAQAQAEANRKAAEEEMSAKELLVQKEKQWQSQLELVQTQVEQERALRERESQYAQLVEQRQQIIQQYSDRVAPELLDLIDGETVEAITQSAEDMAARTERILAQTAEAMQNQRQQMPTARVTAPVSGENPGSQRSFSPEEIRNMSMSDYAKHRKSLLGGASSGGPKNRGLFG